MNVTKVVVTWCQILWLKCTKLDFGRPSWGTSQHSPRPHCWIYGKKCRKWLGEMEGDWEIDENGEGRGLRSGIKSWEGKWKMEGWRKGWRWEEERRRWGRETMSCYGSIFKPWHGFESQCHSKGHPTKLFPCTRIVSFYTWAHLSVYDEGDRQQKDWFEFLTIL